MLGEAREQFILSRYLPIVKVQLIRDGRLAYETNQIRSAQDATQILCKYLDGTDRENFVVILLNTKHRVLGINTVSVGNLDSSIVHPREVFKPAILANASGIIIGHNHPSGDPTESPEDLAVTRRLSEAGKLLGTM